MLQASPEENPALRPVAPTGPAKIIAKRKKQTKVVEESTAPDPNPVQESTQVAAAVTATSGTKRKKAKKPRAKPPYSFFCDEFRGAIPDEEKKGLSLGDISKRCGAAWALIEDKTKYEAMAATAAEERRVLMADAEATTRVKPKRPPSLYNRFVMHKFAEIKAAEPTLVFQDVSKRCAAAWKELSDEEKKIFRDSLPSADADDASSVAT